MAVARPLMAMAEEAGCEERSRAITNCEPTSDGDRACDVGIDACDGRTGI